MELPLADPKEKRKVIVNEDALKELVRNLKEIEVCILLSDFRTCFDFPLLV